MLTVPAQGALHLIIDALDECPNSPGYPTQRETGPHHHANTYQLGYPTCSFLCGPRSIFETLSNPWQSSTFRFMTKLAKQLVIETLTEKASGTYVITFVFISYRRQSMLFSVGLGLWITSAVRPLRGGGERTLAPPKLERLPLHSPSASANHACARASSLSTRCRSPVRRSTCSHLRSRVCFPSVLQ
jgi:hypothetical protein